MSDIELKEELSRLYLEIRDLKERVARLEASRETYGKVVITGAPRKVQDFIKAKKQEGDLSG